MKTESTEANAKKRNTDAEIETMIASVVDLGTLTCQQLCDERADDLDILANLGDFPARQRGQIRAAVVRNLAAVAAQMKRQKCPACSN